MPYTPPQWLTPLILLMIAVTAMNISIMVVPIFAPEAADELGIPVELLGYYTAAISTGAVLANLFGSPYIARYGGIRMTQLCLILPAIGLALVLLTGPLALILGAIFIGLGLGPNTAAGSQILARVTPPRRRGLVFSVKQAGVPLGASFSGLAVPALVEAVGWRMTTTIVILLCLCFVLGAQRFRARYDDDRLPDLEVGNPLRAIVGTLKLVTTSKPVLKTALCGMTFVAMQFSLTTYLVAFLSTRVELSLSQAGGVFSAAMFSAVIGRVLFGVIADKIGAPLMMALLGIVMACGAFTVGAISPGWPLAAMYAAGIVLGSTAMGWNGVLLSHVANLAPEGQVGRITAGSQAFTYVGSLLGPSMFAALLQLFGSYSLAFAISGAFCLIGGLSMLVGRGDAPVEAEKSDGA